MCLLVRLSMRLMMELYCMTKGLRLQNTKTAQAKFGCFLLDIMFQPLCIN